VYLRAADEAGSVPDVFRVLVSLLRPRISERASPLINEVMPTLLGALEKRRPRSSEPWHVLL
jgi:hypothetical protein